MTFPWIGSVVDRTHQKHLLMLCDSVRAGLVFSLVFIDNLALIYIVSLFIQLFSKASEPTAFVWITKIVPEGKQQSFNAWKSFVQSAGFVIGPSIAGLMFFVATPAFAILLNSILLVIAVFILWTVHYETGGSEVKNMPSIMKDLASIAGYMWSEVHLSRIYLFVSMSIVMMTVLDSVEAAFVTETLNYSEEVYGVFVSIAGVGLLAGSFINAKIHFTHYGRMVLLGTVATYLSYIGYVFAPNDFIVALAFFGITFSQSFVNVAFYTYLQQMCDIQYLGRLTSAFGLLEAILGFCGVLLIGLLSIGTSLKVLICCVLIIYGGIILIALIYRSIFRKEGKLSTLK